MLQAFGRVLDVKQKQWLTLNSDRLPHFCLRRLYVMFKNGITEEMLSIVRVIPRMSFIKPGCVVDAGDPQEGGSDKLLSL